jgi:acetylornithine deacetylase
MSIPPFEPNRVGPWLYGRGACDMKSGLAAILAAVRALREAGVRLKGDLVVAFTPDEEYASIGMDLLVTHPWVAGAAAAVITEPTDLVISTCHKGFGWYEIITTGRAAHGSRPDLGVDAIYHMGRVLARLEALDADLARRGVHPLMGRAAVHGSLISGGTELSTYPPLCTLQVEWRTLPGDPAGEAPARLQAILDDLAAADPAFNASLRTMFERGAFALPVEHPIVLALRAASERVLGRAPALGGLTGWPESEVLNQAGIPAILFGPSGEGAHAALERADIPSVARCAEALTELVIDWCGQIA